MAKLTPDNSNLFINPYNFVSLTSKVDRKNICDINENRNLTGYISCTLRVADMLALPDRNAEDKSMPRCYDFYKINGKPIIPGSEIRGCIRSVFEAVTPSCISVLDDVVLSSRKTRPDTRIRPGILEFNDGKWEVFEAEYRDRQSRYSDCDKRLAGRSAELKNRKWRFAESPDLKDGFNFYKKTACGKSCSKETVQKLINTFNIYIENNRKNIDRLENEEEKEPYLSFENLLKSQIDSLNTKKSMAVFFMYDDRSGKFTWISPAAVGRYIYDSSVYDVVKRSNTKELEQHIPCENIPWDDKNKKENKNCYCPACRLFGTLGNDSPVASRVRFSDATAIEFIQENGYLELPELSSPKLSTMEFYSWNTSATHNNGSDSWDAWNYDNSQTYIRGRKFYFHCKPVYKSVDDMGVGQRQIATKPAKTGSTFLFKVYFDKVSETELKQLLWVLTFGENDINGKQMHKIGTGRPVGFGSVKVIVDENGVVVRKVKDNLYSLEKDSFDGKYKPDVDLKNGQDKDNLFDMTALKEILKITNINCVDKKVSYPVADTLENKDDHNAGYQWFMHNRDKGKFIQVLPLLSSDNLKLKGMKPGENNRGKSKGNHFQKNRAFKANTTPNGSCVDCGAPTDINPSTGKHFLRCKKCNWKYKQNKQF